MRLRHALPIVCAALLVLSASAGADEVPPPEPPSAAADPVAATPAQAPAPTPTPQVTAAPAETAAATLEATPSPQATPASTPNATATQAATPPPAAAPAPTPPDACALPEGYACRVPSAVCSILGTDGDDVLTGTPMDDILCGFGGNDQLEGGDGSDVLLGGDGDDVLVGGKGGDCMAGGSGTDSADTTPGEFAEVERSADNDPTSGIIFDSAGRCVGGAKPIHLPRPRSGGGAVRGSERPRLPVPARPGIVPAGAAPVGGSASVAPSDRVSVRLPNGARPVRRGVVRLRVSCSASAAGELVLIAGSRRIAHKRFACKRPGLTVRVRLNAAGRRLVARDGRVRVRMLVLAGGRTLSTEVLLVSRGG